MNITKQLFTHTPNSVIHNSSLMSFLLLSCSSYFLSSIAQGTVFVEFLGYYTIAQYSLMGIFMLIAWKTSKRSKNIVDYKILLITAVVARIMLFNVEPYASNDVDRYLFDGRIAVEGLDPYRVNHNEPALEALREKWQPPEEHAKYATLYPPIALSLFALSAATGIDYAVVTWKFILLGASLFTLGLMVKVLQHANKLENIALIALSPILILETGVGLHLDAISTLAIAVALYFWQQHRNIATGVAIGMGTLVKVLPLMLLLPLIFTQRSFKHAAILVVSTLFTIATVYGFTLFLGFYPVGSIGVFFEKWRFAAPIFTALDSFLAPTELFVTLVIIATVTCSAVTYLCWCNRLSLLKSTALLFGSLQLVVALPLLLSPVIFPWYLMPLIPLLALYPNRYLLLWTFMMPLTYEVIGQFICCGIWQAAQWPVWIIGILQLFAVIALLNFGRKYYLKQSTMSPLSTNT